MTRVKSIVAALVRILRKVLSREAALFIGGIASAAVFIADEITGVGIWVEGDPMQTLFNLIPKLGYIAAGVAIRFNVYSAKSTKRIAVEAARTGDASDIPSPP